MPSTHGVGMIHSPSTYQCVHQPGSTPESHYRDVTDESLIVLLSLVCHLPTPLDIKGTEIPNPVTTPWSSL